MKIENGKHIYKEIIRYQYFDGAAIHPVAVEITMTTTGLVYVNNTFSFHEWIDNIFTGKLLMSSEYNVESAEINRVREFFSDFLFVERTDIDYIVAMINTILSTLIESSGVKIESLSYVLI